MTGRKDAQVNHKAWVAVGLMGLGLSACQRNVRPIGAFPADESGIAVSMQPNDLFAPEGLRAVQRALVERDKLQPVQVSGHLDPTTRAAIRAFQAEAGLIVTGLPDYRTVSRLGLKAPAVFRPNDERGGTDVLD